MQNSSAIARAPRAQSQGSVAWAPTACPACGSIASKSLRPVSHLPNIAPNVHLHECAACELVYLNPRPTPETIGAFYSSDYACYQVKPARVTLRSRLKSTLEKAILRRSYGYPPRASVLDALLAPIGRAWIRRSIQRAEWIFYRGSGRLLDVGVGAGDFLLRAKQRGWNVEGLDIGEEQNRIVSERVGCPVYTGRLTDRLLPPRSFDAITMWQVIEHLHDPVGALRAARELLSYNGTITISTPNYGGWSRRRFGDHWLSLDLPRHLVHFTPQSLERVVELAGFRVTRFQHIGMDGWIRASAKAALQAGHNPRDRHLCRGFVARAVAAWTERQGMADNMLVEATPA